MATSPNSPQRILNQLTSLPVDSLAKTSARPESEQALKDLVAAFGLSSPVWYTNLDPDTFLPKTFQDSLFGEPWTGLSENWPDSGMWDAGSVYELRTLERPTSESASSSWPTASASVANDGETPESWKARQQRNIAKHYNGNGMGTPLTIAAVTWPTARGTDGTKGAPNQRGAKGDLMLPSAAAQWPTPQQHDQHGGKTPEQIAAMGSDAGAGVSNLNEVSETWATPHKNCSTGAGTQGRDGGENLQTQIAHWQTPATDSFRSRGGDRKDEMGLDQQARGHWATPANSWFDRGELSPEQWDARQVKRETPFAEPLHIQACRVSPPAPAIPDGPQSSESAPTLRRRLNPRFVEWLMGFPIGWTEL